MFGAFFFGPRFYGGRYWGHKGGAVVAQVKAIGGGGPWRQWRPPDWEQKPRPATVTQLAWSRVALALRVQSRIATVAAKDRTTVQDARDMAVVDQAADDWADIQAVAIAAQLLGRK